MVDKNLQSFILHVSDFHLTDDQNELDHAYAALEKLANELKCKEIKVDYLIHTGDVINSSDLYEKAAKLSPDTEKYVSEDAEGEEVRRVFRLEEFEGNATIEEKLNSIKTLRKLPAKDFLLLRRFSRILFPI